MRAWTILCFGTGLAIALPGSGYYKNPQFDPKSYASQDVIRRDVAVIGAGASGTYGAIKLKDMGKSVVVVEKHPVFGGHVETYLDPVTGTPIDYGVQAYLNTTVAADFFARFNVTTIPFGFVPSQTVYADFRSGEIVQNVTTGFDFSAYATQLHKYPDPEYGWNLPHPVPEDLLLPFGDFIEKYSLQNIAFTLASIAAGEGNILEELTAYVFQRANNILLAELSTGEGIRTLNNSELYFKAQAELGSSALVSSTVVAAHRSKNNSGVLLVAQTPTGKKLIIASQILISFPITLGNMSPFNLDHRELGVFEQISYTGYYTSLVTDTGLPPGFSYQNAGVDTRYNIPLLPAPYNVNPTRVPGIFYVWYGAQGSLPEDQMKADIIAAIKRLSKSDVTPRFLAFASHTPYKQTVSAAAIRNGFYDDLNGLQGYRNTWYTGNAFDNSGTCSLWNFTKQLLPGIATAADHAKLDH